METEEGAQQSHLTQQPILGVGGDNITQLNLEGKTESLLR